MYQKVKSLERALKIMELLREKSILNEFVSPREAAEAAGISPVSAYNILNTLAECGYARRSGRGKYEEGRRGALPTQGLGVMPRLRELAELDPRAALLRALDGTIVHIIREDEPLHPLTVVARNDLLAQLSGEEPEILEETKE